MADSILDALEELNEEDEDPDVQSVNDALGDDEQYWKARNQAKDMKDVDEEDEE